MSRALKRSAALVSPDGHARSDSDDEKDNEMHPTL
jgi:hypothetical protein